MGLLQVDGERRSLRFERLYAATLGELWAALTEPEQLRGWLAEAVFEKREGGAVRLQFAPSDEETVRGRVLAYDPPHLLEYEWHWPGEGESIVRFELAASESGVLLALEHRLLPAESAAGYGAGWHAHLDRLEGLLEDHETSWDERYSELLPAYREHAAQL
jgi:uncharacterized protein YndB with AHSA1/START domain